MRITERNSRINTMMLRMRPRKRDMMALLDSLDRTVSFAETTLNPIRYIFIITEHRRKEKEED